MHFQAVSQQHRDAPLRNFIGKDSAAMEQSQWSLNARGANEYAAVKSSLEIALDTAGDPLEHAEPSPPNSGRGDAPITHGAVEEALEDTAAVFDLSFSAGGTGRSTHFAMEIVDQPASNSYNPDGSVSGSLLFFQDEIEEQSKPVGGGEGQEDKDQTFILQVDNPAFLAGLGEDAAGGTLEYEHQVYDCSLESLFYDDFFDAQWAAPDNETPRQISWGYPKNTIQPPTHAEPSRIQKDFTGTELEILRDAFAAWDDALEGLSFVEAGQTDKADIRLGWTDIDGKGGVYGYWNGTWDWHKNFTDMSIRFDAGDRQKMDFSTSALHEIGNALGLGDVRPSDNYRSVLEDPFPEDAEVPLSRFDKALAAWRYEEGLFTSEAQAESGRLMLLGVNDPQNNLIEAMTEAQFA